MRRTLIAVLVCAALSLGLAACGAAPAGIVPAAAGGAFPILSLSKVLRFYSAK